MNRVRISAFALALVACAPLAAFAQGVAGDWDLTVETPQGANTMTVTLAQTGEAVTGTLTTPLGAVPMKGTVSAGAVTAEASLDIQGMTIALTFKGKVDGDAFNGNVQLGDFGEAPFTGKRSGAKASAAAATTAAAAPAAPAAGAANGTSGNAAGKWDVVLSLPGIGDIPMTATITQAADKVTGMISSQVGGDVQVSGTMTGNALNLKFTAQTPNGEIPVTMTGTLAGSALTGKASIEGLGEADWTAKRAQ